MKANGLRDSLAKELEIAVENITPHVTLGKLFEAGERAVYLAACRHVLALSRRRIGVAPGTRHISQSFSSASVKSRKVTEFMQGDAPGGGRRTP